LSHLEPEIPEVVYPPFDLLGCCPRRGELRLSREPTNKVAETRNRSELWKDRPPNPMTSSNLASVVFVKNFSVSAGVRILEGEDKKKVCFRRTLYNHNQIKRKQKRIKRNNKALRKDTRFQNSSFQPLRRPATASPYKPSHTSDSSTPDCFDVPSHPFHCSALCIPTFPQYIHSFVPLMSRPEENREKTRNGRWE